MQVHRVTYPAVHVAFVLYAGPVDGLPGALQPLLEAVRLAGAATVGPPLALYPNATQDPNSVLARLCVPVQAGFGGSHRLRTLTLPAVEVAIVRHFGAHRDIGHAYETLSAWIAQEGLSIAEGLSETFVRGPHDGAPEAQWQTDVAVRLKLPGTETPSR